MENDIRAQVMAWIETKPRNKYPGLDVVAPADTGLILG